MLTFLGSNTWETRCISSFCGKPITVKGVIRAAFFRYGGTSAEKQLLCFPMIIATEGHCVRVRS
jgi:hypothetical protein